MNDAKEIQQAWRDGKKIWLYDEGWFQLHKDPEYTGLYYSDTNEYKWGYMDTGSNQSFFYKKASLTPPEKKMRPYTSTEKSHWYQTLPVDKAVMVYFTSSNAYCYHSPWDLEIGRWEGFQYIDKDGNIGEQHKFEKEIEE